MIERSEIHTVEDLLRAFHRAERQLIGEFSGRIGQDLRALDADIEAIADRLGVEWRGCNCSEERGY